MVLAFYGLLFIDRESGMLTLLILFPLVCFLSTIVYGVKHLFSLVVLYSSNGTFDSYNFYFLQ